MEQEKWYVYVVECKDNTLYTGIAKDVDKRIAQHNAGLGAKYTKARRPVKVVYREEADSKSAALKREAQIKRMSRRDKLQMIFPSKC